MWRRYGFVDAFNPQTGWFDSEVIGIDVGISMIMAENVRTGLIWQYFNQASEARRGLAQAGLYSTRRVLTEDETTHLVAAGREVWQHISGGTSGTADVGLHLTSLVAASSLGWLDQHDAATQALRLLATPPLPNARSLAEYAAALVVVRQAWPDLAAAATQHLQSIAWAGIPSISGELGSADRLAVFFQIASGARPATTWTRLDRKATATGGLYVLTPASASDQYLPGLWLDESNVITGASASQMAYAALAAWRGTTGVEAMPDATTLALMLDCFPTEVIYGWKATPPTDAWWAAAHPADLAAMLITTANLLNRDCVRQWFQQDPLVTAARATLTDFTTAAFGPNTSLYQQVRTGRTVTAVIAQRRTTTLSSRRGDRASAW